MKSPADEWVSHNLELIDLVGRTELARIAFTSGEASGLRQAQEIMARFGFKETIAAEATRMAEEQLTQDHWAAQQNEDEQFINNEG